MKGVFQMSEKVKVAPKKTISIRVSVEEHLELKNVSVNRDESLQSMLYPLIKEWLRNVPDADKMTPEEEPEESK